MIGEPTTLQRPSGTYLVDGFRVGDVPVVLTFPPSFELPDLVGVTVRATVFAERPSGPCPAWCDFKHPVDGRWRSVFADRAWLTPTGASETTRSPRKRPPL